MQRSRNNTLYIYSVFPDRPHSQQTSSAQSSSYSAEHEWTPPLQGFHRLKASSCATLFLLLTFCNLFHLWALILSKLHYSFYHRNIRVSLLNTVGSSTLHTVASDSGCAQDEAREGEVIHTDVVERNFDNVNNREAFSLER